MTAPLPSWAAARLANPPAAGQGVNLWLFSTARILHPFVPPQEIAFLLTEATRACGREVTPAEIHRAVTRSQAVAYNPPAPALKKPTPTTRRSFPLCDPTLRDQTIEATGAGLADLWESSPIRCDQTMPTAAEIVRTLFPADALVCLAHLPPDAQTRPLGQWTDAAINARSLIVPSPMSALSGITQDGKTSVRCLSNTGPRRFLVIEQDKGTLDDQASIIKHLSEYGPLAVVVHSGGKSLHAWFYVQDEPGPAIREFFSYACALGADPATFVRCQLVRLPNGIRDNSQPQRVFFYDPATIAS